MTTAIGVVMTEHIVAGRLEDLRLTGKLLRYPENTDELDALSSVPGGELVEILAGEIASLAGDGSGAVDAIGVAGENIGEGVEVCDGAMQIVGVVGENPVELAQHLPARRLPILACAGLGTEQRQLAVFGRHRRT